LQRADFADYKNIPLVISLDGGGGEEVAGIAERFEWHHGEKRIIQHEKHLGLRHHILFCGDLTQNYGGVIILEDDCFVSRNFYDFAVQTLACYGDESRIAGISLYSHRFNEQASLPFMPLDDGGDVFFMQVPSSHGQIWTRQQWAGFRQYHDSGPVIRASDALPLNVPNWPESSWKKYFYQYVVERDLFFAYPSISLLTNFGDAGTHQSQPSQHYQVPIEARRTHRHLSLVPFNKSCNKYDAFFEIQPQCLQSYGVDIDPDTCIDLYGTRRIEAARQAYALSIREVSRPLLSFRADLFPLALNLIYPIPGGMIAYGRREHFGALGAGTRWKLMQNIQPLGCNFGMLTARSSRYYKLGYCLTHPWRIPSMLRPKSERFLETFCAWEGDPSRKGEE
jgi:hypothetical protein